MSVTLKLSDGDASMVADILHAVNQYNAAVANDKETTVYLKEIERRFGSVSMRTRMIEVEGAFSTVLRANNR